MWKYYAFLSAIFAALTAIFSKMGVEGINSNLAAAIRVSFVLILVWGITFFTGGLREWRDIPAQAWLYLLLSAASTGLSWLFYFHALATGDAAKVAPIDKMSVPITIILAVLFLKETLDWKVAIGGILITLGAVIMAL